MLARNNLNQIAHFCPWLWSSAALESEINVREHKTVQIKTNSKKILCWQQNCVVQLKKKYACEKFSSISDPKQNKKNTAAKVIAQLFSTIHFFSIVNCV
jgi:hypothetical protein